MKQRKDHLGLYLFDRDSGVNVLMDEIQFPVEEWAAAPRHLSIALTNACELSCSFCYAAKLPAMLPYEKVIEWCGEASSQGGLAVGFGGGEPTLYPRFAELCSRVRAHTDLAVTMTTHGHRFTPSLSAELTGAVDYIRVSMDGLGGDYEAVRGRAFSEFIEKLKIVRDTSKFGLNVVVTTSAIPRLSDIADFAQSQRASQLLLLPQVHKNGEIALPDEAMRELETWVNNNERTYPIAISVHASSSMGVPLLPITSAQHLPREHLHIDASANLRRTAFHSRGVPLGKTTFTHALNTLLGEDSNEDLVRIWH